MGSGGRNGAVRRYVRSKEPRIRWTAELHRSFLLAIEYLGGQNKATPKNILRFMRAEGLTIAQVKSHLQMHRSGRLGIGRREMEAQLQRKHSSCAADEQGPKDFLCPSPLKRAKTGAYKGMQGSRGTSEMSTTAGSQYCMHDYMQAMEMEGRIKQDGLRWQRDAAAASAAASSVETVGCLVQESGSFKISRSPGARHLGQVSSSSFSFAAAKGKQSDEPTDQCSLSLSLGLDPNCGRAVASSPSGGSSCVISASPTRRSSSDCSGHSGCFVAPAVNLELSLSIWGS